MLVDQEGILVGAVLRAAVLDDPQPPRRDLVVDAVVQEDHAVADVLLQAVAGERLLALLAGDDGRDALVLEPAEQPAQLGAQDRLVGQPGEERLDGVQHDPLGPDLHRSSQPRRTNSPSRSYSPVSSISLRSMWT